jgi:hypothetical protein
MHVDEEDDLLRTSGLSSEPVDVARHISTSTRRELRPLVPLIARDRGNRWIRGGGVPVAALVVEDNPGMARELPQGIGPCC